MIPTDPWLFEEILWEVRYFGDNEELRHILATVLTYLPKPVREFVIRQCFVLSVGVEASGYMIPLANIIAFKRRRVSIKKTYLIFVEEFTCGDDSVMEDCQKWLVAHEIAHAYLDHQRMNPDSPEDAEAKADKLVAEWGLKIMR